jgi:hypothetical protein
MLTPFAIGYCGCGNFVHHVRDVGEGADDGPWVARGPRRTLRVGDVAKDTLDELQPIADWKRPDDVDELVDV